MDHTPETLHELAVSALRALIAACCDETGAPRMPTVKAIMAAQEASRTLLQTQCNPWKK